MNIKEIIGYKEKSPADVGASHRAKHSRSCAILSTQGYR